MKTYTCKICKNRNEKFSGTRQMVRKHLREEHMIRGKLKMDNVIQESMLTANTIAEEWK